MVKTPFWRLKHNFWYLEPPLERTFSEPFESHCGCNHFGSSSGSPCGGRAKSDGGYVCSIQPSSNHGCRRPTWKPEANYLAGGISTPLKNMSSSIGIVPNIWKIKKVWNHQPVMVANCFSWILMVIDGYQWMLAMIWPLVMAGYWDGGWGFQSYQSNHFSSRAPALHGQLHVQGGCQPDWRYWRSKASIVAE